MAKITRKCDGCKKILRKADMYEPIKDLKYKKLCSSCWYKWIKDELK